MRKTSVGTLLIAFLFVLPGAALALDVATNFNPSVLIPDSAFDDTRTFDGPTGIQRFLESKNSLLANTSPSFLSMLAEPNDAALKASLGDPEPSLGRLRTAAELFWDAGQASGLNPQVILVTLNKEQGLITNSVSPDRMQRALNHAMGFDCPDGSACGNLFPGFYYQLFGNVDADGNRYLGATKSLMKSFMTPNGRGPTIASANAAAHVGDSVTLDNTLGDFIGISTKQSVVIGNKATAALYRYTPHVFNGNYNFWRFFTDWFRYANGTIVVSTTDRTYSIIEDGQLQRLPFFVVDARKLDLTSAVTLSPTEASSYPAGPSYGPPDNTVVHARDGYSVFLDGVMHPVTSFVLAQRKLDTSKALPLSDADTGLFVPGSQLTPTDGTVLRGKTDTTSYLVVAGALKKYSAFTFAQRNAAKQLQTIPDSEVAVYPKSGWVIPLDGTVIKSASSGDTAYLVSQQRRLPLTPELFANHGFTVKNVVRLASDEEMASIPLGPPAPPVERTFFSYGGTRELFIFKGGAKHPISPFVAKQRGITPDYTFEASVASTWPDGIAIPPRDGTVVKSSAETTPYLVMNGQLHGLSTALMKNLGISPKDVLTMPATDFDALAKDGAAPPKDNSYFTTGKSLTSGGPIYVYKNGVKRFIPAFVAAQRGMTPDFVFATNDAADWPDGIAIPPRDGTLVKSDKDASVYLVSKGLLRPLSEKAFKNRGYKTKNVKTLPAADIAALQKGTLIAK